MSINQGEKDSIMVLTAKKMGYEVNYQTEQKALSLYAQNEIDIVGTAINNEAVDFHNNIVKDKRVDEANKIASEMMANLKNKSARF